MAAGFVKNRSDRRSYQKAAPDTIFSLPYTATGSLPTAAAGNEGCIVYDSTTNTVKFSTGSAWTAFATGAASAADGVYNAGAWTVDVDANDVIFRMSDTDYNLLFDTNVTGTSANLLVLDAKHTSATVTDAIEITTTGSSAVITNAIDVSDAGIVNALTSGANDLSGTNWDIAGATGKGTFVGLDAGAGDLTCGTSKFTVTHGTGATVIGDITGIASQALAIAAGATNQNLTLDAGGSGVVQIGKTSTGDIEIGDAGNTNIELLSGTEIDLTSTTIDINGNATISGTLEVTGATTLTGTFYTSAIAPASGNLTVNGATGATTITIGNLSTGGITVSDNSTFNENVLIYDDKTVTFRDSGLAIYSSVNGQLDVDADVELEITAPTVDMNASTALLVDTAAFSIDGTSGSNVSVTSANLQLQTLTSGNVDIDAATNLDIDAGALFTLDCVGHSDITVDTGNFEINCTTSGVVTLDGFSQVDFEIANADEMHYTTGQMEFQQATSIVTTAGALTISPTTDMLVANGKGVVIGHTAQETTYSTAELQILGTAAADSSMILGCFSTTATEVGAAGIDIFKGGNATIGSHTIVTDDEILGTIRFIGDDGTDLTTVSAAIMAEVDDAAGMQAKRVGGALVFKTAAGATDDDIAEKLRINSAGNTCVADGFGLVVGSETQCACNGVTSEAQVVGTTTADGSLILGTFVGASAANPPKLIFTKSRNATIGSSTIHVDDDQLGEILWTVGDGVDLNSPCACIKANVDESAVGANKSGGDIVFQTAADGGETLTTVMTIDSSQDITFGSGTHLGLLNTTPSSTAVVYGDFTTTTTGGFDGVNVVNSVADTTGANANAIRAAYFNAEIDSTNDQNWTATVGLIGVEASIETEASASGTITGAANFYATGPSMQDITITSRYGLYVANTVGDATITTQYGVYVADLTDGGSDYGLYIAGADTAAIKVAADASVLMGGVYGSDAADGNLTLGSTTHGTEGYITIPDGTEGLNLGAQGWNGKDNYIFLEDATVAPAGASAVSGSGIFSAAGELFAVDDLGASTLLSPHDEEGYYIFYSKNTGKKQGINKKDRVLKIHMEKLINKLIEKFPGEFDEFLEDYIDE